ncbi:MAG: O-antigen ligase family protein [Bacteroidales bacterium]|nr:O-antigen ligase family protein [Bacteroidales bacterium]
MKVFSSRRHLHLFIFEFGMAALACCLPLSPYLLSISQFLLAANWLAEGDFKRKLDLLRRQPSVLLFASLFLVYCIGFFFSENSMHALNKIKNTLPVLLLPLVIGTSKGFSVNFLKTLLLLFACSVTCAAVVNAIFYLQHLNAGTDDPGRMSVFMSHIRFSLLVNMAIFILISLIYSGCYKIKNFEKIIYAILAASLSVFLFFLGSLTGIVIFVLLVIFSLAYAVIKVRRSLVKTILLFTVVIFLSLLIISPARMYHNNFHADPVSMEVLDIKTANGNYYDHRTEPFILENGNLINIYICEDELKKEWNHVSNIRYDSLDHKGQQISYTLRRYMTSMGLRKDSSGVRQLTTTDILAIENGVTNYRFNESSALFERLYATLWEIDVYRKTGYVQNHSFTQRLEFLKTALSLAGKNILFGVGSGDVEQEMLEEARKKNALFESGWEGKPHNQLVFFLIAFGVAGFAWILFSWIFPVVREKTYRNYLLIIFLIISFVSMMSMETLESYDSIVFFAFFYSLFVFGKIKTGGIND